MVEPRVLSGRNSQLAAGSVSERQPAGRPFSHAHSAAPQSLTESWSSGG